MTGRVLAGLGTLHAINSAVEVDLTGQINGESAAGRYIGLVGGQGAFARAALMSPHGRSIVALPSTARDGTVSRIVARLGDGIVSTARADADLVVTEHGVADLRGATLDPAPVPPPVDRRPSSRGGSGRLDTGLIPRPSARAACHRAIWAGSVTTVVALPAQIRPRSVAGYVADGSSVGSKPSRARIVMGSQVIQSSLRLPSVTLNMPATSNLARLPVASNGPSGPRCVPRRSRTRR